MMTPPGPARAARGLHLGRSVERPESGPGRDGRQRRQPGGSVGRAFRP